MMSVRITNAKVVKAIIIILKAEQVAFFLTHKPVQETVGFYTSQYLNYGFVPNN